MTNKWRVDHSKPSPFIFKCDNYFDHQITEKTAPCSIVVGAGYAAFVGYQGQSGPTHKRTGSSRAARLLAAYPPRLEITWRRAEVCEVLTTNNQISGWRLVGMDHRKHVPQHLRVSGVRQRVLPRRGSPRRLGFWGRGRECVTCANRQSFRLSFPPRVMRRDSQATGLPIYLYIGLHPAPVLQASSYIYIYRNFSKYNFFLT